MAATVQELIEVTVLVDNHSHGGKACKKGDKIKVTAEQKAWLSGLKTPAIK